MVILLIKISCSPPQHFVNTKAKAVPLHAMKVLEWRYSSYSFLTCTGWGEWSVSRPGYALAPGKGPPGSIVQEAGWAPELVFTQRV
jgi:hypothetical protein